MATITKLKTSTTVKAPIKAVSASQRRKTRRQRIASYGVGAISLILTGLSLSHLASGVQLLTQSDVWHSWAMASGIDLGFIALEIAPLCCASATLRATVARFSCPAVLGTLATSAFMNAYAFALGSPNALFAGAAAALGVSIPALIYVLTRVSVAMWIDGEK